MFYTTEEKRNRERASTSTDFRSKKTRGSESVIEFAAGMSDAIPEGDLRLKIAKRSRDPRDQKTSHTDLRHKIKKKFKKCCNFSEESNKSDEKHSNQERLREVGGEFIYLRDKTCTVETLDIEEHFSNDVVKVKFIGEQGGSNMFKLVVTAAWQSNQMRSFHTICGVDLEVESKIRRPSISSCTDGNMSRDSQNLEDNSGSMTGGGSGRKSEETGGREKKGWWKTQRGTEEDWGLKVKGNRNSSSISGELQR